MRARLLMAAGLSLVALRSAEAQTCGSPSTDPSTASADARQQAHDVFHYMAPQLGLVIAGGSPTLGQAGSLGGIGHFSIGVRGNALAGSMPQVDQFQQCYDGAKSRTLPTEDRMVGMPAVDAAIGVFKGLPFGLTNVGGIDVLLSASYVPEIDTDNIDVRVPDGSLKIGYGARVGLLQESLLVPGVSVSVLRRGLPSVNVVGTAGNNSLEVNNLKVQATTWRFVASKSLLLFGLTAGLGRDTYDQSATVTATVSDPVFGTASSSISPKQSVSRTNMFAGASLNLLMLKVTGEVGRVSGGDIQTVNSFSGGAADESRLYGSVGLRLGF
ncbi:MAG: hypothetical protein ABR499_21365 [Gemmatimonadaceae bacterium]